jgi:hypothetical protein
VEELKKSKEKVLAKKEGKGKDAAEADVEDDD